MSFPPRVIRLLSLVGAGALALALAGCGVKGPLEPPPSSGIQDTGAERQTGMSAPQTGPTASTMLGQPAAVSGIAQGTTSAAVRQAPAATEPSVLDWLVK